MIVPKSTAHADLSEGLSGIPGVGTYSWFVTEDRLEWSAGLLAIYGLGRRPCAEFEFVTLVHPDDRVRVEAETSAYLEAGAEYQHEFRIVRPDGEVRRVLDRGRIERSADGTAVAFYGMNVDVTAPATPAPSAGATDGPRPTGPTGRRRSGCCPTISTSWPGSRTDRAASTGTTSAGSRSPDRRSRRCGDGAGPRSTIPTMSTASSAASGPRSRAACRGRTRFRCVAQTAAIAGSCRARIRFATRPGGSSAGWAPTPTSPSRSPPRRACDARRNGSSCWPTRCRSWSGARARMAACSITTGG